MPENLMQKYPAVEDLQRRARKRMPHFAWEFLDSGTGRDEALERNRSAFSAVRMTPRFMQGEFTPDISTTLFGEEYSAPFGVAPVGMNGLAWPGTDRILARAAARHQIPYSMSTAANYTPEELGGLANGMGWYQLYPPRNSNMRKDLIERAKDSGFKALLLTVDVPVISRRERQMRAGIGGGAGLNPERIMQLLRRPSWSLATWQEGQPGLPGLEKYSPSDDLEKFLAFVGEQLNGTLDWDYVDAVRREWDGPLVLKGVLDPQEAKTAVEHGVDGILVSNHGGRQLDGALASVEALPHVAEAVQGRAKILLDSGVRTGLDIARSIALGADFVLCGRAFMFGVAALGERGADHTVAILKQDLMNNMSNLGCATLDQLRERLV